MTGLGSSCGACKFLRRKCMTECIFAPYFSYDQAASHFAAVHKVFGASNVSKLLLNLPMQNRGDAAITIAYEALARMQDPVYGCVAHIFALQQQVANLQEEVEILGNQMASLAMGLPECGNYQETNAATNILQISSQWDIINTPYFQNPQAPIFFPAGDATAMQLLSNQTNEHIPSSSQWDEQIPICDFTTDPLEELLEGMAQDLSGLYP